MDVSPNPRAPTVRPRGLRALLRKTPLAGLASVLIVVGLLGVWGTLGPGSGVAPYHPAAPRAPAPAELPSAAQVAVHWSQPLRTSSSAGGAAKHVAVSPSPSNNSFCVNTTTDSYSNATGWVVNQTCIWIPLNTFCSPLPPGVTIGEFGLNFSVATTPASGIGAAPTNFTWNLSVTGGGLPPYAIEVVIDSEDYLFEANQSVGNVTLNETGLYDVTFLAQDSSCTQEAYVDFPLQVYGSLGPNPVGLTAVANSSTVPAQVLYTANLSALPANWSIFWDTPGIFTSPTGSGSYGPRSFEANLTYFFPGNYTATACFVEPDDVEYACGTSPAVTVGGAPPVSYNVTVGAGPFPVNITFNATITNPGILPAGTALYLSAETGNLTGVWNESYSNNVSLTVSAGCGYPYTLYLPPTGVCPWTAWLSLVGSLGDVDHGYLGGELLVANLTANGTPASWYPTVAYSYGPLNGTVPLNLSLNFSATNGVAPYSYSYTVVGRGSGAANASFYAPQGGFAFGWNGSGLSLTIPLNQTGIYWINVFVADTAHNWVSFSPPLIVLGNVSPLAPLKVSAGLQGPAALSVSGAPALFVADPTGGEGPYTIQWAFGDGTYGSSEPGVAVEHRYLSAGTYQPTVTVTDRAGQSVTERLAPVVVSPAAPGGRTTAASGGNGGFTLAWMPILEAALAGALFVLVSGWWSRRELQRDGEALVESLKSAPVSETPEDAPR